MDDGNSVKHDDKTKAEFEAEVLKRLEALEHRDLVLTKALTETVELIKIIGNGGKVID